METGMNNELGPIGQALVGVQAIRNYMENLPPERAQSPEEVYETLKSQVANKLQVQSTISTMYKKQKTLGRSRTGPFNSYRYWAKSLDKRQTPRDDDAADDHESLVAELNKRGQTATVKAEAVDVRPEILVEAHRVVITHPKCRVIVELP